MLEFLEGIGRAGLWPFWIPVLAWTGLAAAVLGLLRGAHPCVGYRVRQALLVALPASLLAAPWLPSFWTTRLPGSAAEALDVPPQGGLGASGAPVPVGAPNPVGGAGAAEGAGVAAVAEAAAARVDIAAALLGVATVAILLLAIARLAALAGDLRRLRRLRLAAPRIAGPAPNRTLEELTRRLGVRRPVALLEGPEDGPPVTFGARRPVILLPPTLLDSPDPLRTALAHEVVHIRRGDYPWALLDCMVAAVFAFHPLVRHLRRGIERCRETSCDAEVLARGLARPTAYAALLAHTHTPAQFPIPAVAASLSAPSLTLKERLETMENFANKNLTPRRRAGIALCAALVCVAVALTAACMSRPEEEQPVAEVEISGTGIEISGTIQDGPLADSLRVYYESFLQEDRHYLIPVIHGGEVSHYYNATEEEVLRDLARIDVQMEYLQERMDEIRTRMDTGEPVGREWDLLVERYNLLRAMHTERVKASETVKLEFETQKRFQDGGQRPRAPGGRVFQ